MGLKELLFALGAALAVATAFAVVLTKRTQYAALFFVTHLMAIASLYAILNAPVLAFLQIMVYAGAVMVVFVFAIMILDADELEKLMPKSEGLTYTVGGFIGLLLVGAFFGFSNHFDVASTLAPAPSAANNLSVDNLASIGRVLYGQNLPIFEMTGVLLLVAVVGIMVMAKRKLD